MVQMFLFTPCDQASVLLIRSPIRNQCDPFIFFSPDRTDTTRHVYEQHRPSRDYRKTQRDPTFPPPNGGEPVRCSDHFWARSWAELNQCDPDFVRVLRSSIGGTNSLAFYLPSSIYLLKLNFRNVITLELHERACWPEFYLDYGRAHFVLLHLKHVFFCVFFLLVFFLCFFVVSPSKISHITCMKNLAVKNPKLNHYTRQ